MDMELDGSPGEVRYPYGANKKQGIMSKRKGDLKRYLASSQTPRPGPVTIDTRTTATLFFSAATSPAFNEIEYCLKFKETLLSDINQPLF